MKGKLYKNSGYGSLQFFSKLKIHQFKYKTWREGRKCVASFLYQEIENERHSPSMNQRYHCLRQKIHLVYVIDFMLIFYTSCRHNAFYLCLSTMYTTKTENQLCYCLDKTTFTCENTTMVTFPQHNIKQIWQVVSEIHYSISKIY